MLLTLEPHTTPRRPSPAPRAVAPTPDHFAVLERALRVLLCPLDHADVESWAEQSILAVCALVEADGAAMLLPSPAAGVAQRWVSVGLEHMSVDRPLPTHDLAPHGQRTEVGARGFRVVADDGSVAAVEFAPRRGRDLPAHALATLRAVAPAFRAGLETWRRASVRRGELARVLDVIPDAAFLFDLSGTLMHANPATERLGPTPVDADRLRSEAQRLAWSLSALAKRATRPGERATDRAVDRASTTATREVRAGATVHTLRATVVGEDVLGRTPGVLVTLATAASEPPSDQSLRERFGLTKREIDVARLVAEGLSNGEIAERLGVSFYTARNHVERLIAKLGVSSRARVGALLREAA